MDPDWGVAKSDRLLPLSESAEFLGLSVDSMRRLVRHGKVKFLMTEGGHYRLRVRDLEKYQKVTSENWASKAAVRRSKASG